MAKQYSEITKKHQHFISQQKIFFIGTADSNGRVNVSPKGGDTLKVLNKNRVIWHNLTGSGNETAAHLLANNRITIMFCSFDKKPLIYRLYGSGKIIYEGDVEWDNLAAHFPEHVGSRQIFDIHIDMAMTSCGFQVPFYTYEGERDMLTVWSDKKGREGIKQYWKDNNQFSIDGKPTR